MKRIMAAGGLAAALALAACGQNTPADKAEDGAPATAPAADAAAADASADVAAPSTPLVAPAPAAPYAPSFAHPYPGATITQPTTGALGPDGHAGGIVQFNTSDSPDAVVDFYRKRAEASGLASVNTLNRGSARAYGAASTNGDTLNVVADAVPDGQTHVQLSWIVGK